MSAQKATFGAGCFWGVESAFRSIEGVTDVSVGYGGGELMDPTYHDVCTGRTGHAELVEVDFDDSVVTYAELLELFWTIHDPTTVNRQGPDVGTQYRSVIFYHSSDQEHTAKESKDAAENQGSFSSPIVTEISQAGPYYRAEGYHQRYFERQGIAPVCHPTVKK